MSSTGGRFWLWHALTWDFGLGFWGILNVEFGEKFDLGFGIGGGRNVDVYY